MNMLMMTIMIFQDEDGVAVDVADDDVADVEDDVEDDDVEDDIVDDLSCLLSLPLFPSQGKFRSVLLPLAHPS